MGKQQKKSISLRVTEEQATKLDKARDLLGEKTYSKTIFKLVEIFFAKNE